MPAPTSEPNVTQSSKRKYANLYVKCESCELVSEPPFPAELGGDRKRAYYRVEQRRQFAPTAESESCHGASEPGDAAPESGAGAAESGGAASDSGADGSEPVKAQKAVNVPEDKKEEEEEAVDTAQKLQQVRDSIRPRWSALHCVVVICMLGMYMVM